MKNLIIILLMLAVQTAHSQLQWATVETVYNNLITAIGDHSKIAPPIQLSRTESRVAYFSPTKQTIYVEEKFLELCKSLGPDSLNALSFILGHELAHFYRNHGWVSSSGLGYVGSDMQTDWKNISQSEDNHAKDEAEADIFSGFYGLIAGYNAMPNAGKTLRTVYEAYGIPDTIRGYPSLGQRVEIATAAIQKSKELYLVFNVGLYCLATEKFEVSSKLFTHIFNQDYAGAEVLNNLAVSEILWGYSMLAETPSYSYPIFIATETALDPNSRGAEADNHIRKGISYLKTALEKAPSNMQLMLNLASAYTMLNEFVDANYYIAKVTQKDAENIDAICLQGIIAAKSGNPKEAAKIWKNYTKTDARIKHNAAVLANTTSLAKNMGSGTETTAMPDVDKINMAQKKLEEDFSYEVIKLPGIKISYVVLDHSTLIEVYGGQGVDYRFQSFDSSTFESIDYGWQLALASPNANVYTSGFYNVLKISKQNAQTPKYVKYMWY